MPKNETITEIVREFLKEYLENLEDTIADIVSKILEQKHNELLGIIEKEAQIKLSDLKGEKGDKPILGIDYKIPSFIEGKPGYTPIKNKDYFDGKDADETKIIMGVLSQIPHPKDGLNGKDGSPDTGEDIIKKINSLEITGTKQIDASHIKNLISLIKTHSNYGTILRGGGGGITIETPTGAVNGVNTTFYVVNLPKYLVVDGVSKFETVHYTLTGSTIEITDGAPPVQYLRAIL